MLSHGRKASIQSASRSPRRTGSQIGICLCAALIAAPALGVAGPEPEAGAASVSASRHFAFDIPAQPLASALEAYSSVTGIETLYSSAIARERRSAALQGTFTPADALRMLLNGTSLTARSIASDAVTIELQQAPVQAAGPAPDRSAHRLYFSLIQAGLETAFCRDDQIRPGGYRAVLRFTIASDGQIQKPSVVGTTGNESRDRLIVRTLDGVALGSPPPADLQQPIMMVILPRASGPVFKCPSIQ